MCGIWAGFYCVFPVPLLRPIHSVSPVLRGSALAALVGRPYLSVIAFTRDKDQGHEKAHLPAANPAPAARCPAGPAAHPRGHLPQPDLLRRVIQHKRLGGGRRGVPHDPAHRPVWPVRMPDKPPDRQRHLHHHQA